MKNDRDPEVEGCAWRKRERGAQTERVEGTWGEKVASRSDSPQRGAETGLSSFLQDVHSPITL